MQIVKLLNYFGADHAKPPFSTIRKRYQKKNVVFDLIDDVIF